MTHRMPEYVQRGPAVMANASLSVPARRLTAALLVVALATLVACGGASPSSKVQAPLVRDFSPFVSKFDFNSFEQTPTFTNGWLQPPDTHPSYPGEIVVFFQDRTILDPNSVFTGGRPELGLDLSAIQILQFKAGVGNIPLELLPGVDGVIVEPDRIRLRPAIIWQDGQPLENGQYSIGVFSNVKNVDGKALISGPVFHSFTVGSEDLVRPFVVTSSPANNETGVGAGSAPPAPSSGNAGNAATVRTSVFGPTSPDLTIRFNEGVDSKTVNLSNIAVVNASTAVVPQPGQPPVFIATGGPISPAAGYPILKSIDDGATLPSNGHEILWRAEETSGGFPFGKIIEVTVTGWYDTQGSADADPNHESPDNEAPIADLAGNQMLVSYKFQFQTLAPPDLPQNPFPEYAIWWSAADRVGAIDVLNQADTADAFTGAQTFQNGIPRNVLPTYTDSVANAQNVPGFEPTELSIDNRTNGATCHTWVYALSPNSGQIVIVNTRTSIPVAIIETPQPGGISNQTGGGQAANVLAVTNSSANTLTIFDINNVSPGLDYINGPIFIQNVQPTGNTPRAVSLSLSATGSWNRDPFSGGPPVPIVMYVDFTDGVVNTTKLREEGPIRQINLGANASPNDVVMSPCLNPPGLFLAAISQGGLPGEGKVAYYISGPSCSTGASAGITADSLVGDLTGFDGPAGLDEVLPMGNGAWWMMAESGAIANRVQSLGLEVGAFNQPRIVDTFDQVGANPVAVAHRPSWGFGICIDWIDAIVICSTNPSCWYNGTEQQLPLVPDTSLASAQDLYICARGASQVTVLNMVTGLRDRFGIISIPGVRFVASTATQ